MKSSIRKTLVYGAVLFVAYNLAMLIFLRLNLTFTGTFFLLSATWLVIDFDKHGAALNVHRMPIHLQ